MSVLRFHPAMVFLVAVIWSPGCNRPNQPVIEEGPSTPANISASPRELLASVFARYRNAASYHDRGIVRLGYEAGGREQSRLAPMNVWFNQNQLYVDTYDVHLLADAGTLMAWILDAASNNFDSQVLRIEIRNQRPTVEMLFPDPVLADRIAAGLAGPPPQLEWLFAREPMKLLFHDSNQFDFGPSRMVDRRLCRCIRVNAGDDTYEFWVDEVAGIVRRVTLPPVVASPSDGEEIQSMSLSLELNDASFDVPRHDPDINPLPPSPRYVRQFSVPETIPPSRLQSAARPVGHDSRDSSRRVAAEP